MDNFFAGITPTETRTLVNFYDRHAAEPAKETVEVEIWIRGVAPWDDGEKFATEMVEVASDLLDDEDRLEEWLESFAMEWAAENMQPASFFEARM